MRKKKIGEESIFLDKYVNKQKLGKGAFGDVFLVENLEKELLALKIIDKKKMQGENGDMIEYLKGEIKCMKEMNYRHLVKLVDFSEDDNYYYMILEYCDGKDLVNEQALQPGKVFSLNTATSYLSQVILGLECLHKSGYLHRDIKLQNVLIKNEGSAKILKIADFGFAKKARNLTGTVLGTEQYMSPEIYHCGIEGLEEDDNYYSYEVDMWAFGVVFYYMLNMAFPFQLHPYWTLQVKFKELVKQAENFSYRKSVMTTRNKLEQNCTDEMEDLFKKIFTTDQTKRITFSQIRQHPVFAKHFPKPSIESEILYKNKFKSKIKRKTTLDMENRLKDKLSQLKRRESLGISSVSVVDEENQFPQEKEILRLELDEIKFLHNMVQEINLVQKEIGCSKSLMFAFNLIKYEVILLKKYLEQLNAPNYNKKYKALKLDWPGMFTTQEFRLHQVNVANELSKMQMLFNDLYTKCKMDLEEISKLNEYFSARFSSTIEEGEEQSVSFFKSYRRSTDILYSTIKEYLKTHKLIQFYYYLCGACICHVYNDFYGDQTLKRKIFSVYLAQEKEETPVFSYERFIHYLKSSSKETILKLAKKIIEECMMK